VTTITYTVTDAVNLTATDAMTVTVVDNQNPVITCKSSPANRPTIFGQCSYTTVGTEFDPAYVNDNCPGYNWSNDYNNSNTLAGAVFNPGTTTVLWTVTDAEGLTATCSLDVVVKISTKTTVNTSAESTRWLDQITLYAVVEGQCADYNLTGMVEFFLDGISVGSAPAYLIPFGDEGYVDGKMNLRATLIYKVESPVAIRNLVFAGHNPYSVTAKFTPDGVFYDGSESTNLKNLFIYKRLAEPNYTAGLGFYTGDIVGWITSATSNTVTVKMAATLVDKSTPTGDVRGAKVTFCYINGDGTLTPIPSAKDLPVGLVDQLNSTIGFASADVQLSLSKTAQSATFDIAVVISGGYYNAIVPFGTATVTVARTLTKGSILGNCSVLNDKSAGQVKGANGTISYVNNLGVKVTGIPTTDIAFNVEYNKKGINPQGYLNLTVISWYNSLGLLDNKLHTYFIKSNAITSFVVGPLTTPKLLATQSIFEAKANIKELVETSPGVYQWISVEGNSPIRATITDGAIGLNYLGDKIAVTFFRASGGIWFSNNWDVSTSQTIEQQIESGGFVTVSSGTTISKSAEVVTLLNDKSNLLVYPNPFSDKLRFEFITPNDTHALISLYDITGRLVQTVFDSEVKGGVDYNADFKPVTNVNGMYFYRATIGDQVFNGKVMYTK
jgi:hypothetical protein